MKKILCVLFIAILAVSVAIAQDADTMDRKVKAMDSNTSSGGVGNDQHTPADSPGKVANGSDAQPGETIPVDKKSKGAEEGMQKRLNTGNFELSQGKNLRVQSMENNHVQLHVNNHSAETAMEMVQERQQNKTKVYAKLSNGKNAEIKVMPDAASERAIERLGLKLCSQENNCSIELKETGSGNQTEAAYEVKARKQARILGLFPAEMPVQAHISSDSGEIISSNKPWWAFLASE